MYKIKNPGWENQIIYNMYTALSTAGLLHIAPPKIFPTQGGKLKSGPGGRFISRVGTGTYALNKYFLTCLSAYLQ
jgi:hypothetical protein